MKKHLSHIILCFCFMQNFYAQEDGVVSLDLPVRNSLKFNKYIINPTFSFVREQNKYISFYNKKQWVQFNDAPNTYLFSYSGRFRENIGVGVGLFQQDYGVLTTFGGILNFAYNVKIDRESNLTFGMNLGFYKSGLNKGKVITNFSDPSLDNVPSNSLITINPGINYGTTFFDFGVSLNNLVLYNIKEAVLIKDDPEQSIQAHLMYTGYISSRGFFDQSKFSGLVRSEFKKNQTIVSGIMMLTIPKGLWAQTGYNSLYGASAGFGINISTQISMEYNYEKAIGDLSTFGSSHEITLAYKFRNNNRYNYSGDDDEEALIIPTKKKRHSSTKRKTTNNSKPYKNAEERAKIKAAAEVEKATKLEALTVAKVDADAKIKAEEETRLLEAKVKAETEDRERERLALEAKKLEDAKAKLEEQRSLAEAETEEKARIKVDEAAKIKLLEEAQAKTEANERLRLEKESKTKPEEEIKKEVTLNPKDEIGKSMVKIEESTNDFKIKQEELLAKLSEAVKSKDKDLKDLKEENDLSDKGIYIEPKPFKSISAEKKALEILKANLDNVIELRNAKIQELESLYDQRQEIGVVLLDEVYLYYQKTLKKLKSQQIVAIKTKADFIARLEAIEVAIDIERKRRIKRAAYDNEDDKYLKDRAALNQIKKQTPISSVPLEAEDFNFGDEQSNIQIVKDIKNEESGYYLVLAVHSDIVKRDNFLTKAVSAGETNINFFYDVNTSKYYIYYQKFNGIDEAIEALKIKGNKPYNKMMSIVKIKN